MAASVDMFGTGGEGLGGLFTGQQFATAQNLQDAQTQQSLASAAHANALAQGTDLTNQYEQAVLPDKIAEYKSKVATADQDRKAKQFDGMGEKFGQVGSILQGIPAVARPAALKQLAAQSGIGEDNPMLQHLMSADPEQLPDTLLKFSKTFYEQGDKARAENLKRDLMYRQAEMQAADKAEQNRQNNDTKLLIAQTAADARRDAANIAAAARGQRGGSDKPLKETYDNFLTRTAREKLESGEWTWDQANEYVQRAKLNQGAVRVPDTGPAVMTGGTPTTAQQRVESAVANSSPTGQAKPAPGNPNAPKVGTVSKGYRFKGGDPSKQENWEKM